MISITFNDIWTKRGKKLERKVYRFTIYLHSFHQKISIILTEQGTSQPELAGNVLDYILSIIDYIDITGYILKRSRYSIDQFLFSGYILRKNYKIINVYLLSHYKDYKISEKLDLE